MNSLATAALLLLGATLIQAVDRQASTSAIRVELVNDEAEAVLEILAKRLAGRAVFDADWSRLLSSEGYVRLKAREASLKRAFDDDTFKSFVLSHEWSLQATLLRETLDRWSRADMHALASSALRYLPAGASIRAKVYPVIKPATNSFVFDIGGDPAIFLYLDPSIDESKFRNTVIHELHHIGFGGSCPSTAVPDEIAKLPPEIRAALTWIGAFGEGFAMLAAAGSPDTHPHAVSGADERATWDQSIVNSSDAQKKLEAFFFSALEKRLTEAQQREAGFAFFGVQGPWYTVGWQMAVAIERAFGRSRLIEAFCDPRKLLTTYNEAAVNDRAARSPTGLWSPALITKLAVGR